MSGELEAGWVAEDLREEFPRLALLSATVEARPGRSPAAVRQRLRDLSSRVRGPTALTTRQGAVPHAYRVFFRHIGLDPDVERPPAEAALVDRLLAGGFRSRGRTEDAVMLAVVETGVPVWVLDADRLRGPLGLRLAEPGERLGAEQEAPRLPSGRIVVADGTGPVALLFGEPAPDRAVTRRTERMTAFAVTVAGVPEVHVEEAMATCLDVLTLP